MNRPEGVADGAVVSVFRVQPEMAGMRLDLFLHAEFRRTSRAKAQAIVRTSAYDEQGQRMKPSRRVQAEERIYLWRPPWDETPVPTIIPIIYEDDHLLVVCKPAGLPVHPTARYHNNTLINMLKAEREGFLSLAHRLDRETSGLIILCKTTEADRAIKHQFEDRDGVTKVYRAITWGIPKNLARDVPFRFECAMKLPAKARYGVKMEVSTDADAMHSSTVFTLLGTRQNAAGESYSLVRCGLETGRQHQIRLHLAQLGSPIVGDKLYGPDETMFERGADGLLTEDDLIELELPRHALHAAELGLRHPISGEELELKAPLPEELAAFWSNLSANE